MANSVGYHEPFEKLPTKTVDLHRALTSLQEELEAVDWYKQRADVTADRELKEILLHNMREEMEHAMMVLEWIRRQSPDMDKHMRTYLFTEKPITRIEKEEEGKA
jgi:ferritin-like protein